MSSDLTTRNLVLPITGEVRSLDDPDENLALLMSQLKDLKWEIDKTIGAVSDEFVSRLDRGAKWTRRLSNGLTVSAPSPQPAVEYDAEALYWALDEFYQCDRISEDAFGAAVAATVVYKAKAAGLKALAKVSPELADLIAEHSREVEKPRNVTVKRS